MPAIIALCITSLIIPCWIKVCHKWHLFEKADDRKKHRYSVPSMGGIAIFCGFVISVLFFTQNVLFDIYKYVVISSVILFFTGFFDDLLDMRALLKLSLQLLAAILVVSNGIRLDRLFGVFGLYQIPVAVQYITTIVFIIGITNAYNLIDGLDGLASSLGIMASLIFGILFIQAGFENYAVLSFSLMGALLGFLYFNFHPAKIFMGDTGSLLIGFILSVQAIQLLTLHQHGLTGSTLISPLLIIGILFIPVYDVFRVSVIRILTGYSPLRADRNHIHHMICINGFGQRVTSILIVLLNLFFVGLALLLPEININLFMILCICIGMIMINSLVITFFVTVYSKLGGKVYRPSVHIN